MLNYSYRSIQIGSREKLLIDFEEKKYEILSTFLESDVAPFPEWFLGAFEKVLSGECDYQEVAGNICRAKIHYQTTRVYDDLAKDGMGAWCEVDTEELYRLIKEWCEKLFGFKE